MAKLTIEDYLELPYTIEVFREDDPENPGWVARVVELDGCITQADSFEELEEMIADAMRSWIIIALEDGFPIPEPRPLESYSGKFVVRLPRSLHRELVEAAEYEGVSLNMFVTSALSRSVNFGAKLASGTQGTGTIPKINWPRLSDHARHLLILQGYSNEVQEVDERLFASWIDSHLDQARVALENADYWEAIRYIRSLNQGLEKLCSESPLIQTYCQAISILEEQITFSYHMHTGLVEQNRLQQRVLEQVRTNTRQPSIEVDDTSNLGDLKKLYSSRSVDNEELNW